MALGAVIARRPVVAADSVRSALRTITAKAGPDAIERNLRALDAGLAAGARAAVPA